MMQTFQAYIPTEEEQLSYRDPQLSYLIELSPVSRVENPLNHSRAMQEVNQLLHMPILLRLHQSPMIRQMWQG